MIAGSAMWSHRDDLAGDRDDAGGAEDGGEGEDDRHGRGDERAEGQREDEQRHAERHELRVALFLLGGVVERLRASTRRRTARSARPGWRVGDGRGRVDDGLDPVDRRSAGSPLRSNWTSAEWLSLETASLVTLATTFCLETVLATSAMAALKAGSSVGLGLALDEHHLARLLREAGVLEDLHRPCGSRRRASGRSVGVFWPSEPPIMNSEHDEGRAIRRWRSCDGGHSSARPGRRCPWAWESWGGFLSCGGVLVDGDRIGQSGRLNRQGWQASAGSRSTQGRGRVDPE